MDNTKDLETKPIPGLLWTYALPAVISQIIASVYNIVDRIFLGQNVGALAIAGLAITLPIMNIVHAFGSLVGAGSSARMSIVLGRRDVRWAEKILGNSVWLTLFFGILFVSGTYIFMDRILMLFGASADTIAYAREYMVIIMPGMFLTTVTYNLTGLIRASGYPTKSMWILVGGALLNILLDALFIPVLHWGIAGAAWGTTISMSVSSVVAIWHFVPRKKQAFVRFRAHCWQPKMYIFKNILAIGVSPFSMNLAASAVAALLNSQLIRYGGDIAVGTYGVINSFSSILFLLLLGICQGMQPIAGYNYGARQTHRLKEVYLLTLKVCLIGGAVGALLGCIFPRPIIRCFTSDTELVALGIPAMRFLTIMLPVIAFTITNSQFFQSIDKPWIAIVTSLSRQVLFLIPLMYLVPSLCLRWNICSGLTGLWASCTICDVLGAALSAVLLTTQLKVFRPGYEPPIRKPRRERMPKSITILLLMVCSTAAMAQTSQSITSYSQPSTHSSQSLPRPRVGVVFSGGGAKGAAHIGVLKYLEEQGIPIDYVAGTSMGSIISGLYALGYSPNEMAQLIAEMDWSVYMSNAVGREFMSFADRQRRSRYQLSIPFSSKMFVSSLPNGFIGGANLTNLFNRLSVGYQDSVSFDSLPVPFACVATDIATGQGVVLRSGIVPQAMRASMAIPGVFSPVEIDGKLLADGGLANNFPVDVCLEMGADIVIGVEVSDEVYTSPDEFRSLPQMISQYMNLAVGKKREENRKLCALYLHPDITGYNMLSFSSENIDTLVNRGYREAVKYADEIADLKRRVCADEGAVRREIQQHRSLFPRAKNLDHDTLQLSSITIMGVTSREADWLQRKADLRIGQALTGSDLAKAVNLLSGTGCFSSITYSLHSARTRGESIGGLSMPEDYDCYRLQLDCLPAEPHLFSAGFRYDSEEAAAIALHLGFNQNRLSGFRLLLDGRLGYSPLFSARMSLAGLSFVTFNLDYNFQSSHFYMNTRNGSSSSLVNFNHRLRFYVSEFYLRGASIAFGIEESFMNLDRWMVEEGAVDNGQMARFSDPSNERRFSSGGLFASLHIDELDNAYFATRGVRLQLGLRWGLINDEQMRPQLGNGHFGFGDLNFQLQSHHTFAKDVITFIPQLYTRTLLGNDNHLVNQTIVGGEVPGRYLDQQLPFVGLRETWLLKSCVLVLRADFRFNIASKHYIYLIGNILRDADTPEEFVDFTPESFERCVGAGLKYAYASPIGPISLTAQWSDITNKFSLYFNLGYNF